MKYALKFKADSDQGRWVRHMPDDNDGAFLYTNNADDAHHFDSMPELTHALVCSGQCTTLGPDQTAEHEIWEVAERIVPIRKVS